VHAPLIDLNRVLELDAQFLEQILILVAVPTGFWEIRGMDQGLGVGVRKDVVRAVAVLTVRNLLALTDEPPAVLDVSIYHVVVAGSAVGFGQVFSVRKFGDTAVAIGAAEVGMDTAFQLSVSHFCRFTTGIGVTVSTDIICQSRQGGTDKEQDAQEGDEKPSVTHVHEPFPGQEKRVKPLAFSQCRENNNLGFGPSHR
jgi:hypothetical protein